jgi:predicted phosphoadenosine phosphosulfate sulfurtransferase
MSEQKKNVYQLVQERLKFLFDRFDYIYVSFSGGKDSGVLLNLCIDYIREHNLNRKLGVMHLDYEAQYEMTTKYVEDTLNSNKDILEVYHCCVPFKVTTCCSMYQAYWRPWEDDKKDIWVREKPKNNLYNKEDFDFYRENMWDYEFQKQFSEWLHQKTGAKKVACLVGIRTQESLNRWRTIYSEKQRNKFIDENGDECDWSSKMYDDVYNFYPIYDWKTSDIWTANAKFGWTFNELYELYYKAGVPVESMRVASPFISQGQDTLKLYKVIDPQTWGKMVGRVNGVNFTGLYGGTTAMNWKAIKLQPGQTWEKYMYFLLDTLPEKVKNNYLAKLETSKKFWKERGGCLDDEVIEKLKERNIPIEVLPLSKSSQFKHPVRMEYLDDIDISEFASIPTYKRMCVCIMKNDHLCKYMGFSLNKEEVAMRKNAIKTYEHVLNETKSKLKKDE